MLSTNITDEISLLRSLAVNNHNIIQANITRLSSKINVVEANTTSFATSFTYGILDLLKITSKDQTDKNSILTLENKLQLQHSYVFGAKSIGLWDMDGNIPNPYKKV